MFSFVFSLIQGSRFGVIGVSVLLSVVVGIAVGWNVSGTIHKARYADTLQTEMTNLTVQYRGSLNSKQRELDIASESLSELSQRYDRINETRLTSVREVVKYVKKNNDCDISRGAIGLLNEARDSASGVSKAAQLSDEEKQSSSTITQRAEIEAHIQCVAEYNKVIAKDNALIDWLSDTAK